MKVSMIGTGYVGLVTGLCFCELGHEVVCIDIIDDKVDMVNAGVPPIFEIGLEELLRKHLAEGHFHASAEYDEVLQTDVTFICVGTPSYEDGSLDLRYVKDAADDLGTLLRRKRTRHTVVLKSTVPPTTTEQFVAPILQKRSGKKIGKTIGLAMNPEFLREGSAIKDFLHPDRIIIGASDPRSMQVVRGLYGSFHCPILEVTPTTAEMIKVANNAALATRISMINEIGNVCKALGIDAREVAKGIGMDARIGPAFLKAGAGFGGSCFPKDVKGFIAQAKHLGLEPRIMQSVIDVNEAQPLHLIALLEKHMKLRGKTIAMLGLAFKPETDDVRESRSFPVIELLLRKGAGVKVHDPKAMANFKQFLPDIHYSESAKACVKGADAVLIMTEWPEYSNSKLYGDKLVIDGRGAVKTKNYEGICW